MVEATRATLYGVSLGPGDPQLMTRRAHALLQRPGTLWTYPVRSTKSPSYAMAIAERAGLTPPLGHQPLLFPMTHDAQRLARHWLRAAQTVHEALQSGIDVMFLVEGDASTYATFGHLARTLQALQPDVSVEVVPGVTSFLAGCAQLRWPLAEQDDTVAVVPAAYGVGMVERLLDDFDTLVLMKVKPLLDDLIALLERRDLLTCSCFIEKAGAPEERVVHDLRTLKGTTVNYLSLLIVKNPQRQRGERIAGCKKKTAAGPNHPPGAR
ncbi:precorrin-2 C20-methyltransferase [Caldimonas brevitalea]|uniref:Precorrin-2 C(20)-methyltransferase n=2 Tax=Caldimonas brevitalea TaxID=413882 RepID=A0A0G3BIK7_9BURK|nr:precorrin-2 C(20)-methyltransferase [Caldimonas brevitalea]AKJ27221.1 precorrin-2 C20-methyltransferase [Caldimonas brevitalea]